MRGTHPLDEILQQYVLDRTTCTPVEIGHIESCPDCQAAVAAYGLLTDELAGQPATAFSFDLTATVMAGVQEVRARERIVTAPPAKQHKGSAVWMAAMIIFIIGVPAWLFRKSAYFVFTDMSAVFYWVLLAAAAITVGLFLLRLQKKYQDVINLINK